MTRNLTILIAAALLALTLFVLTLPHAALAQNRTPDAVAKERQQVMIYWLDRGAMALEADEAEKARMAFERAVMVDPREAISHANLGRAHLALDHVTAAHKYLRTALDIDPQNLDALHWGGLVDLRRDDSDSAKQKRDKLLTLCSSTCDQYRALAAAIGAYADEKVAAEQAALSGDAAQ